MSSRLTRFIIGFIFIIVLCEKPVRSKDHICRIYTERSLLSADCSEFKIEKIPQDLDKNLQVLDVSNNNIHQLNENTFKRYRSLVVLKMRRLAPIKNATVQDMEKSGHFRFSIPHHKELFAPLIELEELDLSYSQFTARPEFIWPTSLKRLSLAKLLLAELNLENLSHLQTLKASENDLESFPKLHAEAPIEWMDLTNNPLKTLKAEDLAPYCRLQYLGLQITSEGTLTRHSNYCQCKRFEKWVTNYDIGGSRSVVCFRYPDGQEKPQCNLTFDPETMSRRKECLAKLPNSPLWKFLIMSLVFSLICPVVYVVNEVYQRYKIARRQAAALTTVAPPEIDPESTVEPSALIPPEEAAQSA